MSVKKTLTGIIAGATILTSIAGHGAFAKRFDDTADGKWYSGAVDFCSERLYMAGTDENSFSPDKLITRQELAAILHSLDNSPTYDLDDEELGEPYPFPDIQRSDWFKDDVLWVNTKKLMTGYPDGKFGVGYTVSRQQMALTLYNLADYRGNDITTRDSLSRFKDADKVAAWAKDALQWAVSKGVIAGANDKYGDLYLNPNGKVTRAEAACMVRSFYQKITAPIYKGTNKGTYMLLGGSGKGSNNESDVRQEIQDIARGEKPNLLYIGLAVKDPSGDFSWIKQAFAHGEETVCDLLSEEDIKDSEIASKKIADADIIYVGGGDTVRMIGLMKQYGIDAMLRDAAANGCVMAGSSAGAICFCESGESSVSPSFMRIDAIGCLNILYCPHAYEEPARYELMKKELMNTPYMVGVAMDGAALEIRDGQYRAVIYAYYHTADIVRVVNGEVVSEPMSTEWRPLSDLVGE